MINIDDVKPGEEFYFNESVCVKLADSYKIGNTVAFVYVDKPNYALSYMLIGTKLV